MERINNSREYREKKHNDNAKRLAKTITQNLYTYLCISIPLALILTIFTDFTMPTFGWRLAGDGIITVALMVCGERLMVKLGSFGGKLDDEYAEAQKRYKAAKAEAKKRMVALLMPFCEWQIDQEFERAKRARCAHIRIKYEKYVALYEGKSLDQLKKMLPLEKAIKVDRINKLEPIELTPDMLLYNCSSANDRRDIKISGEDYENEKIYGRKGLVISVVTCIVLVGLPLTFAGEITLAKIIYTLGKLAALLYRMAKGYAEGAKAYHTIEVRHLDSKSDYLEEFVGFVDDKIYLTIADEYTQIKKIAGIITEEKHEDPCVKLDEERAGDSDLRSKFNPPTDPPRLIAQQRGAERYGYNDGVAHFPS